MINVALCGCLGKMGKMVSEAISNTSDIKLVCGIDRKDEDVSYPLYSTISEALDNHNVDVFVDFTLPASVEENLKEVLPRGIDCVVGTTGLSDEKLQNLSGLAPSHTCLFYAPNFTTGAVLMMEFSKIAASYFPDAEVIEYHHAGKVDAPSGTARLTAQIISKSREQTGLPQSGFESRGLYDNGVCIHSVRSNGFMAKQDVIFGDAGQTLTISHDSWDRKAYMPGVLLGIRSVKECEGLIVGLENFMK